MSTSHPLRVSVIIPVYNGRLAFKACLQIVKLCLTPVGQISSKVVVADGCTDGSDHWAEQFGTTVIKSPSPEGAAVSLYGPGVAHFLSQYKNLFRYYTHQTSQEKASIFWGACGAIRQEFFGPVKSISKQYRNPSTEDIAGCRLKQSGYYKTLRAKYLKWWESVPLLQTGLLLPVLIPLNFPTYQFFGQKCNLWFTLRILL